MRHHSIIGQFVRGGIYSGSVVTSSAFGGYYATNFPATETTMSQTGKWLEGLTNGLDWGNISTTPGLAYPSSIIGSFTYADNIAILTGSWGNTQTASCVVNLATMPVGGQAEIELLLRSTMTAHTCSGYEFLYSVYASYNPQIVRWNGPLANNANSNNGYTIIGGGDISSPALNTGDVLTATISGGNMTFYYNGSVIGTATDTNYPSGSPGFGFYPNDVVGLNWGISQFTASTH